LVGGGGSGTAGADVRAAAVPVFAGGGDSGAAAAVGGKRLLSGAGETISVGFGAWLSVVLPAGLIALVLGIQPSIARRADGTPLFFPFGIDITLPAVMLPHLIIGAGEAVVTVLVWRLARARRWVT